MSAKSLMVNRCTIQRATITTTAGEQLRTWANSATGVRCLVQEDRGIVRQTAGGAGLEYDAIGFFPTGTDIRPQGNNDNADRIVMTKPSSPGTTFVVKKVGDESGMGNHLTAYLKRLPSGS